jgi:hypothetical protein
MEKRDLKSFLTIIIFIVFSIVSLILGCAEPAKTLDNKMEGPQIVVNPETIRLGVATLRGTKIVFSGSGFEPGDSVFIKLLNVSVNGEKVDLSIASGDVETDGTFKADIGILTKVSDFLRADIESNEKMENVIVVTKPTMPEGRYKARAISMLSDKMAECTLNVEGPSMIDSLKDWIGTLLGKIVKK